jgi:N-acetylglucosamine-6-phosphate deacetylase
MPISMIQAWTGRDCCTGEALRVECENGRIRSIGWDRSGDDAWLAPGLIDLQVNGFRGHDINANDLTAETVQRLAFSMLATGVTTFVPTLITASEEKLIHHLRVIAAARRAHPLLAQMIPFVHMEGPHIAPEDGPRGAHSVEHIRPPNLDEFMRWQAASGNLVGMVTISPHYPDSLAYIREVTECGTHIALGHSSASAEQVRGASSAGACLSTHLGNGLANPLPRHPNLLWAQLADDRLTATFIADGHHLPADTLTVMLRAKTVARSILVSDAVMLAGLHAGIYETPVGGRVELHADGRLNVVGTGFLAGATAPVMEAIAFVVANTGFSLGDAVCMATANPGRFVGGRGVLRVGAPADVIRFRWEEGATSLKLEDVALRGIASETWGGRG